jgi:predicted transcriptional regulator
MEKTTLYLPNELQRSLLEMAKREGRSQAEIIRAALAAYFSDRAPLPLRSIGAGSDDEVSGATSEGWLRKNWKNKNLKKRKTAR